MGFEVLRVLPPGGDALARWQPEAHRWLNEGKGHATIDLKTEAGRAAFLARVRGAHALIESNRAGVMERLGVGPEALRRVNPRLVYVRVAGYREDPAEPGHDLTYLAASGLLDRLEEAWPYLQLADVSGAFWVALAVMEGLRQGGGFFEVYLSEAPGVWGYPAIPGLDGSDPAYRVYPAARGRVALAALEPHLWSRFCQAAGHPEWEGARGKGSLHRRLEAFFRTRTDAEWEAWARKAGVPLRAVRQDRPKALKLPWRHG